MQTDSNSTEGPIFCESCQNIFTVEALASGDYKRLRSFHLNDLHYAGFETELIMIIGIQDLCQRHPEVKEIWEDNLQKRMFKHVEPSYDAALLAKFDEKDQELLDFLKSTFFQVEGRMNFVKEALSQRKFIEPVLCPNCKVGQLKIDTDKWVDPDPEIWTT